MTWDDRRADYLESGPADGELKDERLDLIREVLQSEATWAEPKGTLPSGLVGRPTTNQASASSRDRRMALLGIAAVMLLTLTIIGVSAVLDGSTESGEIVTAMNGTELAPSAGGTATLRETGSGWWIRLDLAGLPPAPKDTYYQGWVWRNGEGVSIGTFHNRDGTYPIVLWAGVDVAEYPSIWVTLQDEGAGPEASDRLMMTAEIPGLEG
jgi:Anti-sigma-K factor rskA